MKCGIIRLSSQFFIGREVIKLKTEITIEFSKDCPKAILDVLKEKDFLVLKIIPMKREYHEMDLDDSEDRNDILYRCIYNGTADPDDVLDGAIKNHPSVRHIRITYTHKE